VLYRVLPPTASPPSAIEVAVINRDLYRSFDLDYVRPGPDDGYAALAHHRYAASWSAIARLLDVAGDGDGARDARELARTLRPAQDE